MSRPSVSERHQLGDRSSVSALGSFGNAYSRRGRSSARVMTFFAWQSVRKGGCAVAASGAAVALRKQQDGVRQGASGLKA